LKLGGTFSCPAFSTPAFLTGVLNAIINDPPKEWKRPRGRPRQRWLRTIENELKHQNLGLWSARHRAMTVISGVISWKRRRSCRGMLHDDGDDDDDDDDF